MSLQEQEVVPSSEQLGKAEDEDEQRRLSVFHLVGLAAGGMIGSGWLMGADSTYRNAGSDACLSWLFGGLVMLVIAGVMVELGTAAPKTGGLIFLPLQSSGALVATVVAAGLWIVYAINLASEAVAMTRGLSWKVPGLFFHYPNCSDAVYTLTPKGWGYAVAFAVAISAVNLVAPRLFFRINSALTVAKVVIPVLTFALLIASSFDHGNPACKSTGHGVSAALTAVITSGVIYSYVGYQGPLDLAGNIKRRGIGEAVRMRWAVFGTLIGSMVLYISLQAVFTRYPHYDPGNPDSPYTQLAFFTSMWWLRSLGWLLRVDAVLSPMGAGLVFAHSLTREVAALSRAHLTHRGLQAGRMASLKRRYDVYWLVLLVDFFLAAIALAVVGGTWETLVAISGVLTLVVYAVPGVVLVSLRGHLTGYSPRRRNVHECLARASFALITLLLYWAGFEYLWPGMVALAVGVVLLLWLPVLARWLPAFGRVYDAKEHVMLFRQWRTNPAAQAAIWLIGHLVVLMALTLVGKRSVGVGLLAVATALAAFEGLVRTSKRHLADVPPLLPTPAARPPGPSTDDAGCADSADDADCANAANG